MKNKFISNFAHGFFVLSSACLLFGFAGCASSSRSNWCFSDLQNVVNSADIRVKEIVAVRILSDSSLEVITKEGGPLGGGGAYLEMEKIGNRWTITKTEFYDD